MGLWFYGALGKEHGNYCIVYWGYIGIRELLGGNGMLGLYRDSGTDNENYHIVYWGDIRIAEGKMETTISKVHPPLPIKAIWNYIIVRQDWIQG